MVLNLCQLHHSHKDREGSRGEEMLSSEEGHMMCREHRLCHNSVWDLGKLYPFKCLQSFYKTWMIVVTSQGCER